MIQKRLMSDIHYLCGDLGLICSKDEVKTVYFSGMSLIAMAVTLCQASLGMFGSSDTVKKLGLTPAQQARLSKVESKYNPKVTKVIKEHAPGLRKAQRTLNVANRAFVTALGPLMNARAREITAILTPAQRQAAILLEQKATARTGVPPNK